MPSLHLPVPDLVSASQGEAALTYTHTAPNLPCLPNHDGLKIWAKNKSFFIMWFVSGFIVTILKYYLSQGLGVKLSCSLKLCIFSITFLSIYGQLVSELCSPYYLEYYLMLHVCTISLHIKPLVCSITSPYWTYETNRSKCSSSTAHPNLPSLLQHCFLCLVKVPDLLVI